MQDVQPTLDEEYGSTDNRMTLSPTTYEWVADLEEGKEYSLSIKVRVQTPASSPWLRPRNHLSLTRARANRGRNPRTLKATTQIAPNPRGARARPRSL